MKRVLVTGAAGFLGSHLVDSLLADGCFVYGMDNLSTGDLSNLAGARKNKNFVWMHRDVRDSYFGMDVDEIYNFACPASPPKYQADPIGTFWTSVIGTKNAIDCAIKNNAKLMQASTSEVYGDPLVHPQPESYWGNVDQNSIRGCYDEGKRAAETLLTDTNRVHGTDFKIVRIFNTYGPRLDMTPGAGDGRVVSNFIDQAIRNEPITIYGDGMQTRSFCFVDDLIRGVRLLMDSNVNTPVNIGNPSEYTVLELAETIIELTNSRSQIVFCTLPSNDPKKRKPDISKAFSCLGWHPKIDLKTGLKETISYYRSNY